MSVELAPVAAASATLIIVGRLLVPAAGRPAPTNGAARRTDHRLGALVPVASWSTMHRRWAAFRTPRPFGPADLATWIDDVSRSVRRGTTLRQTLVDVAPTAPALTIATEPLRHRLQRGAGVVEASERWAALFAESDHRHDRQLVAVAAVLSIATSVGGGAAAPLDRLAAAMRQSAADDLERGAQSAQALISARVLTFVPIVMCALLLVIDPDVRDEVRSTTGAALLFSGLLLNLVGGWWMRRVITSGVQ